MRALLGDIERNGDAVKLWLSENCAFEAAAFTTTQSFYNNFRIWCDDNGLHAVSRPKLRDMICGQQPGIRTNKQRITDPVTGASKPMWGMTGIRLRTAKDDLADGSALAG